MQATTEPATFVAQVARKDGNAENTQQTTLFHFPFIQPAKELRNINCFENKRRSHVHQNVYFLGSQKP